jgi:hypothetical protein
MTKTARPAILLATAFFCALAATSAAGANRTQVSALGNDANPCSVAQPCRTLQAAFAATPPGGEIEVLDPTGYGQLTINHSVSIQGHGWASLNGSPGGNAITINAGPNDKIQLHGLIIEGFGTGQNGILFTSGKSLLVENTTIQNFVGNGIAFKPTALSALTVSKTTIADNILNGILVQPTGAQDYQVVFKKVEAHNNSASGITVDDSQMPGPVTVGSIIATASDCTVSDVGRFNSVGVGYLAIRRKVSFVLFGIHGSVSAGYATGLKADGAGATIRVSQTDLETNATMATVGAGGGAILSYGSNFTGGGTITQGAAVVPTE